MLPTVVALLALAGAAPEPPREWLGTWGLPPIDAKPGLTGSFLGMSQDRETGFSFELSLNPGGWSCGARESVGWSEERARFEWPNRSARRANEPCWIAGSAQPQGLELRIFCPYQCTGDSVHELRLERIAADRLISPDEVVVTFCSSKDPLRQELCRPGDLARLIAARNRAARQLGVLDGPELPDAERELLAVLAECHSRGGDKGCLVRTLEERRGTLLGAVERRQKELAEEHRKSTASATSLNPDEAARWPGTWHLVNDKMVGTLTIGDCKADGCDVSLNGDTNYAFGRESRRGTCSLGDDPLRIVDRDHAFSYVEPAEQDRNQLDAGPFANFCRLDLERAGDGFRAGLRGSGCALWCHEADVSGLSGEYHARPKPSFACPETTYGLAWDEENVCLDPELAALDRELAAAYARSKAAAKGPAQPALVAAQRAWLAQRRERCDADRRRSCLVDAYRTRLEELGAR